MRRLYLAIQRTGAPAVWTSAAFTEHRHMDIKIVAGCMALEEGCITMSLKWGKIQHKIFL